MASNGALRSTTRPQWPPASIALAVLMLVCTGCHQPSATPAEPPEPADVASAEDSPRIKQLFMRDTELVAVLNLLSVKYGVNIIPSKRVGGKVDVDLSDASGLPLEEILVRILRPRGYRHQKEGRFIYVMRDSGVCGRQHLDLKCRVFRPEHRSAMDVAEGIRPLLSVKGKLHYSPSPDQPPSRRIARAEDDAEERHVVIVMDFPEKIEEIAGRVRALDQPDRPTKDR